LPLLKFQPSYQSTLCSIPEQRISHLHCSRSFKLCGFTINLFSSIHCDHHQKKQTWHHKSSYMSQSLQNNAGTINFVSRSKIWQLKLT